MCDSLIASGRLTVREISVLVPSLNSGRFIAEAITSALQQRPAPLEVLVQDAGSTDQTMVELARFGGSVKVVQESDRGQADALNRAVARAKGEILVWLNADDLIAPGAFAAVVSSFERSPDAEFVYGDFEVIDAEGRILRRFVSSAYDPARVFTHGCYIFSGAIYFRRTLMERVGQFDDRFHACMDLDYLIRIGEARSVHAGRTLAQFRLAGSQKSTSMRLQFLRESHAIRWREARSVRRRVLAIALSLRDAIYLLTQPVRMTRAWSSVRGTRRL
jgi:glycosyltransferase involved in cell wall biosynthesis